jgi:hypothetical protein
MTNIPEYGDPGLVLRAYLRSLRGPANSNRIGHKWYISWIGINKANITLQVRAARMTYPDAQPFDTFDYMMDWSELANEETLVESITQTVESYQELEQSKREMKKLKAILK